MAKEKILMTGGTGKLGKEMKKVLDFTPTDFDITKEVPKIDCDVIIHAAAYTDVAMAEIRLDKCFATNVNGTFNVVRAYKDVPFVYISTEYAKHPLGVYAVTKYLGEEVVRQFCPHYLILRTLFKPNPWPFPFAYEDQYTQGDYVDVIAKLIAEKVKSWDKKTSETCFIGTGRKTILELARRTRPDVEPNSVTEQRKKVGDIIPYDYE